ncbi:MAG: AAA family ATPase [Planctomycetota bacterium]
MIIERIQARDFMRFRSLDLRGFPPTGAVAIVGPNESGKSAIGEAICFALFGATPRAPAERAHRAIRWGAPSARVELRFEIPGAGHYTVIRDMDREGGRHARLKPADTDVVLAEGVDDVGRELSNLLGFHFGEFRYSFYLAQNELDLLDVSAGHATRQVIYKMLGIDLLDRGSGRIKAELETLNRSYRGDRGELRLARALLETTGFDPAAAEAVETELQRLKEEEAGRRRMVDEQKNSLHLHEQAHKTLIQLQRVLADLRAGIRHRFLKGSLTAVAELIGGHLKTRREERDGEEKILKESREQLEEASVFGQALERLTDTARIRAEDLKRGLKKDAVEKSVSRTEELEDVRGRIKTERRRRLLSGIQFLLSIGIAGLFGGAAWGFHTDAEFIQTLKAVIAQEWRMPAALAIGGGFLLIALVAVFRFMATRRSLARARRFRDGLEGEIRAMRKEVEALDSLLADKRGSLKAALPFIQSPDLRDQGYRLIKEFPQRIIGGIGKGVLAEVQGQRDRAREEVELREGTLRRRAALVSLLERRSADLFEGYPDAATTAESAFALSEAQDLDALELEVSRLMDRVSEIRSHLLGAEREAEGLEALPVLWEEAEVRSKVLLNTLEKATVHVGELDFKRFRKFVSEVDASDSPSAFFSRLEEELARLRSAFPAGEELERRREKVLYDLEQELATLAALSARIEGLDRESRRIGPQLAAHRELVDKIEILETRMTPLEHDIAVRRALIELFNGTVTNVKNRFGPSIGKFVGSILRSITKERYGKVQVSADLDIAVFSRERNDFADLEEVSGGTRDQVLVCLRLALAQALLHARMGRDRNQFLFLDEPISSFDEERSLLFLDLVKGFSENFKQIFVTIHMVNTTPRAYQGIIHTSLEEDRLELDLA